MKTVLERCSVGVAAVRGAFRGARAPADSIELDRVPDGSPSRSRSRRGDLAEANDRGDNDDDSDANSDAGGATTRPRHSATYRLRVCWLRLGEPVRLNAGAAEGNANAASPVPKDPCAVAVAKLSHTFDAHVRLMEVRLAVHVKVHAALGCLR